MRARKRLCIFAMARCNPHHVVQQRCAAHRSMLLYNISYKALYNNRLPCCLYIKAVVQQYFTQGVVQQLLAMLPIHQGRCATTFYTRRCTTTASYSHHKTYIQQQLAVHTTRLLYNCTFVFTPLSIYKEF